jgi:hypothetical protein
MTRHHWKSIWLAPAMAALLAIAGCATTRPAAPQLPEETEAGEFTPARAVTSIALESGPHADLFSPESYAVWVGPDVMRLKQASDGQAGIAPDPRLEAAAEAVSQQYVVIECHLESVFADTAVAYKVVEFGQVQPYLETPDGRKIYPLQKIIGSPVHEEQRGTLKLFRRTNLLLFPRRDLWQGNRTLKGEYPSVRLVLEGYNARFHFEWADAAYADPGAVPVVVDDLRPVKTGFQELMTALQRAARVFD